MREDPRFRTLDHGSLQRCDQLHVNAVYSVPLQQEMTFQAVGRPRIDDSSKKSARGNISHGLRLPIRLIRCAKIMGVQISDWRHLEAGCYIALVFSGRNVGRGFVPLCVRDTLRNNNHLNYFLLTLPFSYSPDLELMAPLLLEPA